MGCKAIVLYWSQGGNTRKVAETIHERIAHFGISSEIMEIEADLDVDVVTYDLVFLGSPVYFNLGPEAVMRFLKKTRNRAANLSSAPERPGRYAVVFCTYGGGHTGVAEAVPLLKYMGQMLEHDGVRVVEEWPVAGEFPGVNDPQYNIAGRLGDITGRPNDYDLLTISKQVTALLRRLQHKLGIEENLQAAFEE